MTAISDGDLDIRSHSSWVGIALDARSAVAEPARPVDSADGGDISAVVVTFNSERVIAECIGAIQRFLPGAESIVVDNGSADATLAIVKDVGVDKIVCQQQNLGFGAAVNAGASAATRELLLVLNPDAAICAIDANALAVLALEDRVGIRACAVRMGDRDEFLINPAWHWTCEMLWSLVHWFLLPREITLIRPRRSLKGARLWAGGAALILRTSEFEDLGGFDDSFFLYFEDFDLAHTYRNAALPIAGTDAVRVTHSGQQSSPRHEERMIAYALLGLLEYVAKWHGPREAAVAARVCVRALSLFALVGSCLGHVPLFGERSSRKSAAARTVLALLDVDARDHQAGQNGSARRAFATALHV